jgi:arylsulfatase
MNRRTVLRALGGLAATAARGYSAAPRRPNVLFLMTDEHRADCVGYVNPVVRAPNLDALARDGVAFTNAYSTSPSCVPARAAIYTGQYPSQCGAPTYITYLPRTATTFMERLRKSGYHTAAIGKQHFGKSGVEHGYDYEDLVDGESVNREDSYWRYLHDAGMTPKDMRAPAGKFASRWKADPRFHIDDYVGERGLQYLRDKCPVDKPWFLTVSFHGPHQPFDGLGLPTEKQYDGITMPKPATTAADLKDKPPHFADLASRNGGLRPEEIDNIRRSYLSKITFIDGKIGKIVAALKARGEYDNTLIVFTADHGDYMGEFGMVYKAQYLSEALMRIPMLAKPPVAGFQSRREDAFVQNFDIAATSLTAAGVAIPVDMTSRDLSPFWTGKGEAARRKFCFMDAQGIQGVRDNRWKLVHYRDREYGELYDLANDPAEKRNLWNDPRAVAEKTRLTNVLLDHIIAILPRSEDEWNVGAPKI